MSDRPRPRPEFFSGRLLGIALIVLLLLNAVWLARLYWGRNALEGKPAPEFSLPLVSGSGGAEPASRLRLSDLRGKIVLLDFWASWCEPCIVSIPTLARVHRRLAQHDALVVGINTDEGQSDEVIAQLAARLGAGYPIVRDTGEVAERFQIQSLPTLFVVDRDGRVADVLHHVTERSIESALRPLLPPAGLRALP